MFLCLVKQNLKKKGLRSIRQLGGMSHSSFCKYAILTVAGLVGMSYGARSPLVRPNIISYCRYSERHAYSDWDNWIGLCTLLLCTLLLV